MPRQRLLDWDAVPLGTDTDDHFARTLGMSVGSVQYHRKRRGIVAYRYKRRNKTLSATRVSKEDRAKIEATEYPEWPERPRCRADCENGPRPCPWVSCHHHLYLDVSKVGGLILNWPTLEPWELEETCSLDLVQRGGMTLEEVGDTLNISRERVRQIEREFMEKLVGNADVQRLGREYDLPKVA